MADEPEKKENKPRGWNSPTMRQIMVFSDVLSKIEKGEKWSFFEIMRKNGYSEFTSKSPKMNLWSKRGFQLLLAQIKDEVILAKIYEVMVADDKRSSLTAADMLLKLKDRYPAQKSKVVGLFGNLGEIKGDEAEEESLSSQAEGTVQPERPAEPGQEETLS